MEILDAARVHLAREGAAALSLRAVARDLGMVSSAVYRYVPNRDALLTMLIIDAYNSLGSAVEKAESVVPRSDHLERFLGTCHGVRTWALAHPHEYALVYGSPVPGYAAPTDTIASASRVPNVLVSILGDIFAAGNAPKAREVSDLVTQSVAPLQAFAGGVLPEDLLLRGLTAWSSLFGAVSLELFGQLHDVVAAGSQLRRAYFEHQMRQVAEGLGLVTAS